MQDIQLELEDTYITDRYMPGLQPLTPIFQHHAACESQLSQYLNHELRPFRSSVQFSHSSHARLYTPAPLLDSLEQQRPTQYTSKVHPHRSLSTGVLMPACRALPFRMQS